MFLKKLIQLLQVFLDLIAKFVGLFIRNRPGGAELPRIENQLLLLPAATLTQRIKSGKLKSRDVVKAFVDRIQACDGKVNSVVQERFEAALDEAGELDKKIEAILESGEHDSLLDLPFLGIPFTGKDSIAMAGMYQTAGLFHLKGRISDRDAECVANVRRAGAIPIALTNIPELCFWFDSDNTLYGRTNNPYNLSRIPGGSTGGNAACIAYAGSVLGVGGDIGGSIRMPAFFCGIFGHKTAPGIVSDDGHFPDVGPRAKFLSLGPLCRYACDLKPMLKVMAGDGMAKIPKIDLPVDFRHVKLYYMYDMGYPLCTRVEEELKTVIDKVSAHMNETYNVRATKIRLSGFNQTMDIYLHQLKRSPCNSLAEGMSPDGEPINAWMELIKWPFGMSTHTLPLIMLAIIELYTADASSPESIRYCDLGDSMKKQLTDLLDHDGILLFPPHPEVAPKHKTTIFKLANVMYTAIFNLLNVTITQCPVGLSKSGLPLGVQVIAAAGNDHLTLAMAEEIEKVFGGWKSPSLVTC